MKHVTPRRTVVRTALAVAAAAVAASAASPGFAANASAEGAPYPERPIRLLVGFAPGGGTDTTARAIAQKLSQSLGHQVVIDNRPGAAGNIAAHIVAKANPDGYTLLMGTIAALAINPTLYGNLPFDPVRDFAPITQAVNSTNILVVHPSVKANNVPDLIALAKASPGNVLYGSSGVGGAGHLAGELFCTMAEQGLKGFDANNWYGLLAPAKTPKPIVAKLNAEVVKVLEMPDIKQYLFNQGLDPAPTTPEEFGAYIKSEMSKWAKVVRAAGASAQ